MIININVSNILCFGFLRLFHRIAVSFFEINKKKTKTKNVGAKNHISPLNKLHFN